MYNQKSTGRALSIPGGIAMGTCLSMILTIFSCAVLAWMVDNEKMQWEKMKRQRLMVCLLSGAAYLAVLLSLTALFFGGQYQAVGVTSALILAGSGTAGLLGVKPAGKRSHRKIGKRTR